MQCDAIVAPALCKSVSFWALAKGHNGIIQALQLFPYSSVLTQAPLELVELVHLLVQCKTNFTSCLWLGIVQSTQTPIITSGKIPGTSRDRLVTSNLRFQNKNLLALQATGI